MGDLSANFSRSEFACKCGCGLNTVDAELLTICQAISDHFDNAKVTIDSGNRCKKHNATIVGSAKHSWHIKSRAADVVVAGISPRLVAEAAAQYGASGIKTYSGWTHIDTRNGPPWRVMV
jgi:uncharacterized protein YcbK (DUF882 family)